jgi:hypothetical protein
MKEIPVHPDAAIFPMMSEEEIAELAEDIKANGLIHPLVTGDYDGQEVLVDGRNRLAACKLAGIKPTFRKLNGEDQRAFIFSVNINRRHMTMSQRAMAAAMIYPSGNVDGIGRGKKDPLKGLGSVPFSKATLTKARFILRSSKTLAQAVLDGTMACEPAFEKAQADQAVLSAQAASMERLQKDAPDLANLVAEERLTLPEAISALNERIRKAKEIAQHGRQAAQSLSDILSHTAAIVMAFQQGEREMIDAKKFPAIMGAMETLIELHKHGA